MGENCGGGMIGEDGGVGGGGGLVSKCSIYENIYWISSLRPKMMVRLWIQQRQVSPCDSSILQGTGLAKYGGVICGDESWVSSGVVGESEIVRWVDIGSCVGSGDDTCGDKCELM